MFAGDLDTRCYPRIVVMSIYMLTLGKVIMKYRQVVIEE
jgi:hypothetical protein